MTNDEAGMKGVKKMHFWLALDQKGSPKLTDQSDYTPTDQKSVAGLDQTISGMEESLTGFSHTIAPFLFTSPFPKIDADYEVNEKEDRYQLSYREGGFDVEITMRRDFGIVLMKVAGPAFTGTMKPQLTQTDLGFLVTSYEGTYQPTSESSATRLSAPIDYKIEEGFQLPSKLRVDTAASGGVHKIEFQFADYQVKKR